MILQILKKMDEIIHLLIKYLELQLQQYAVVVSASQDAVMPAPVVKQFNIDDYLTVNQIAIRCKVSVRQVYRYIGWGLIVVEVQIGEKDLFSKEQIDTAVMEGRIAKSKRKGRPKKN